MEWIWVIALMVLLLGPVAWALTVGRRRPPPETEDRRGLTGAGDVIHSKLTDGR